MSDGVAGVDQNRYDTITYMNFFRRNRALLAVLAAGVLISLVPVIHAVVFIGSNWQGVTQAYGDEILYQAQMHAVGQGYFFFGNPYFLEHRLDAPLVIFGGSWLAAIPLFFGIPLWLALFINYTVWSVIFLLLCYWLFREFTVSRVWSALGSLAFYLPSADVMFRPSSRQEVHPFFVLFFIALARFIKNPDHNAILFLGLATGATFYVFSYLWQTVVIILGLVLLYALVQKNWPLARATLLSSILGGAVGSPVLLYVLWQTRAPYFWESIARFGLVDTHLPMAEIIYSGGWIGVLLIMLGVLYWRVPAIQSKEFKFVLLFVALTGLGLWIMQGSNLITGKLLETGEHMRRFIVPWLAFASALTGYWLWYHRRDIRGKMKVFVFTGCLALIIANTWFAYQYPYRFFFVNISPELWNLEQGYAAPIRWLDEHESSPVVVWGDPHNFLTIHIPVMSKHYVLYTEAGKYMWVPNQEIQERYLVSQYFANPTEDDLKADLGEYMGRGDTFHKIKTIERGIKICRILFFFDTSHNCGIPQTSIGLLGETFFKNLEKKFTDDIRPNIEVYLKKYHVSYILKDTVLEPEIKPETLSAVRVYSDGRYEIYQLPWSF